MQPLIVFCCQYLYVVLLGLQSQNVIGRHFIMAAATSTLLGIQGFYLTEAIASSRGLRSAVGVAFVLAGPCGICTSMWLHPHLKRWFNR